TVDGTITPSTTAGTTGGTTLALADGDYDVKIYSFTAEAGKRYSAVAYQQSGEENIQLDGSFSDAYGAGEITWGGGFFGLEMEGLPIAVFEATSSGTYYLNVRCLAGGANTFIIKIYSNTPAAPVLSPAMLADGTTAPQEITITAEANADIKYVYASIDDTLLSYTAPFVLDVDTMVLAFAVKDGIYSGTARGGYWYDGTKYPGFSPSENIQPEGTAVSITGAEAGDTVYYTTDGTNPYNSSTRQVYTEPSAITVGTSGLNLAAIIKNSAGIYGSVSYKDYTRGTPAPSITNIPGGSTYTGEAFDAMLASSAGASIYYTLDGTAPTTSSTLYTAPIPINRNTRIKAIAVQAGITSTEMNQFLNITTPRVINIGDTVQGMSVNQFGEWFSFTVNDAGIYKFEITPENTTSHGFEDYSDWYNGSDYPVLLYDNAGTLLANSLYPIDDANAMKYNFPSPGTYKLKIRSRSSSDDKFSLKIVQGIKLPVPSIPVDNDSIAYIKEGALTLSTAESGGTVYYTLDGTEPATTVGGSTYEYTTPISLTTTAAYEQINVKAITVVNPGTDTAAASEVKTFAYRLVPGGLTINSIRYGYYGDYTFNSTDTYSSDSYTIRAGVPGESYAGYAISSIDFAIKLDDGNDTWISLGNVTGSPSSLANNKTVTWSYSQTPFVGNAILAAEASDVAGNTYRYEIPIQIQMNTPTVPTNLTATPVEGGVQLNWDASTYVDGYGFYYLIYRGTTADQVSTLVGRVYYNQDTTYKDTISDTSLPTYYYGVKADTSYYGGGRSSGFSNIVSGAAITDKTDPVITNVYIPNSGYVNSTLDFSISASDNSGLKEIKAEISLKDQNSWQEAEKSVGSGLTYCYFDLAALTDLVDGEYDLKVTVTDYYNNTAVQTAAFTLDNTAPPAPVLQAEGRPGMIKLSFTKSAEDISYYYLHYKLHDATTFSSIYRSDNNDYYHNLNGSIGSTYDYKIVAYDRAGNQSLASEIVSATVLPFSPTLSIVPDASKPGEVLNITATGLLGQEAVYLYLDDNTSYTAYATTDNDGQAVFAYNIPNGLVGAHRFRVEGYYSKAKITKTYTIVDYVPTVTAPSTAKAGESITIGVDQFGWISNGYPDYGYKTVKIYLGGVEIGQISCSNSGDLNGAAATGSNNFPIPYTASGNMEIRAESTDGYSASTTIEVSASAAAISLPLPGKRSGDLLPISVSGFAPNEYIYFYKAGQYITGSYNTSSAKADASGNAVFDYRLGANDAGSLFLEAKGATSLLARSAVYEVLPAQLSLNGPTSVYKDLSGSFSVTGFNQSEYADFYVNGVFYASDWGYAGATINRTIYFYETGNTMVTVKGRTSGLTAAITCEIKNPTALAPVLVAIADAFTAGSTVSLNASGFKANEQIKFYSNLTQIGAQPTDSGGGCALNYTIPAETPDGSKFIFAATGDSSQLTAFATAAAGTLNASYSGSPKPGDTLQVTITGAVYTNADCRIYLDGEWISDSGTFAAAGADTGFSWALPYSIAPGTHKLELLTSIGAYRNLALTVTAPATAMTIHATTHVISLSGFAPNEAIEVRRNGQIISGISADASGNASYTPPQLFAAGEHLFTALGTTSNFYAAATLTVAATGANLTLDPVTAAPGALITLALTGFNNGETIRVYIGSIELTPTAAITADTNGAASGSVTIPVQQAVGTATIRAVGIVSGKSASRDLTITALAPQVTAAAAVGDTLRAGEYMTIQVSGFPANTDMIFTLDAVRITVEGTPKTNAAGAVTVSYKLPAATAGGTHRLTASGGGFTDTFDFTAEAQTSVLKLSDAQGKAVTEGKAGQTIIISGDNYLMAGSGDTTAVIEIGSVVIASIVLQNGSFSRNYTIPADLADGNYTVKVTTSEEEEAGAGLRVDNTAPGVPVTTVEASFRTLTVRWTAPADTDLAGYNIYRRSNATDPWVKVAEANINTTAYTDMLGQGIGLATNYSYEVRSYDRLGNESSGN
ncbi:MAG: hypothetical protein GXY49_11305, partial [Syntrophomonadaceae bacterium]|nr:hypothetical protein [Syntrophomonadaceae bacterium]